jgi:uncharacterized membrane protein required for colicin V production
VGFVILDLILIAILLIICFVGYKVGFLVTLVKIASGISGLILAILLVKPTANVVTEKNWDIKLETNIYNNITSSEAFTKYSEAGSKEEGLSILIEELGIPKFVSNLISHKIVDSVNPMDIASSIADNVSYLVVCIISFFALLIFSSLFFFILKKIVQGTRKSIGLFRFIDGVLGIGFYAISYIFFLYFSFWILYMILPVIPVDSSFMIFMTKELHLEDEKFGIAKYFYQENIIRNFIDLIF